MKNKHECSERIKRQIMGGWEGVAFGGEGDQKEKKVMSQQEEGFVAFRDQCFSTRVYDLIPRV